VSIRLGFIGAGFIGQLAHIQNYAEVSGCELYALAEMRPQLRGLAAQRYGFSATYAHHHEMLADPQVDAVVIVTPRPFTAPFALDALKAGKHVLTEKPMAHSVAQAQQLVDAAAERQLVYTVGCMKRHDAGVAYAAELACELRKSGELGRQIFARAHCFMGGSYCNCDGHVTTDEKAEYADFVGWPLGPDWMDADSHHEFAWFLNVYCHNINLLRYLTGSELRVDSARLMPQDSYVAQLQAGDHPAVFEAGRFDYRDWDEVTEIYFEGGRLRVKTPPALLRNVPAEVELYRGGEQHQVIRPQPDWSWAFRRQAEAFMRDVSAGQDGICAGADAIVDLRVAEAIWRLGL
jgi:predicted dehydrogenase